MNCILMCLSDDSRFFYCVFPACRCSNSLQASHHRLPRYRHNLLIHRSDYMCNAVRLVRICINHQLGLLHGHPLLYYFPDSNLQEMPLLLISRLLCEVLLQNLLSNVHGHGQSHLFTPLPNLPLIFQRLPLPHLSD